MHKHASVVLECDQLLVKRRVDMWGQKNAVAQRRERDAANEDAGSFDAG